MPFGMGNNSPADAGVRKEYCMLAEISLSENHFCSTESRFDILLVFIGLYRKYILLSFYKEISHAELHLSISFIRDNSRTCHKLPGGCSSQEPAFIPAGLLDMR